MPKHSVDASDGANKDVERLLAAVRLRVGRYLVTPFIGSDPTLRVAVLEHRLEELVSKSLRAGRESGIGQEIEADTAAHLRQAAEHAVRAMKARGRKPVLVIQGGLRRAVARVIGAIIPVIALEEIPESMPLQVVHTAGPGQTDG